MQRWRSAALVGAGVACGILGTLLVQWVLSARHSGAAAQLARLFQAAHVVVEEALPGARVLDVNVAIGSVQSVNYVHETLYDAHVTYQRSGRIKTVVLPFGFAGGTLITPRATAIVVADDQAKVEQTLGQRSVPEK